MLKSRNITSLPKVYLVKAMVFPVVIYGCESLTIKKGEHPRIDAFEPWCWRRLLRVPWTARRSNQSILKEISPEYSFEGLIWATTPVLWPPYEKNWFICKDPDAGKDWMWEKGMTGDEMLGWHHQLDGQEFEKAPGIGDGQGGLAVHGVAKSRTRLSNWTELNCTSPGREVSTEQAQVILPPLSTLRKTKVNQVPSLSRSFNGYCSPLHPLLV